MDLGIEKKASSLEGAFFEFGRDRYPTKACRSAVVFIGML